MPRSLLERDRALLWHPYTQMLTQPDPLPVVRGERVYLHLEDGRRILDGISSWWVNLHGHSHPKLNEALAKQARELEHVMFAGCTHRPAVDLAERLVEILPRGLERIFYSDNGSTAVEVALKMTLQYWSNLGQPGRETFVVLQDSYHGDTVGAMSASEDSVFTRAFQSMLFPVVRARGFGRDTTAQDCLADLGAKLAQLGDTAAGVLIEPMLQGAGGMIVWPAEYVSGVRRLCDRFGTLMIADEVMTGFGTGRMFACEHAAVSPDLICLSKGITAGYLPLGATAATAKIFDAFLSEDRTKTFFHGHSYTANPLACAVGVASLDLFREEGVMEHVLQLEGWLRRGLEQFRTLSCVEDVRGIGGVAAVELKAGQSGYLHQIGPRLAASFLKRGTLLRPLGNILYFMPPYPITEAETNWVIEQIGEELAALG